MLHVQRRRLRKELKRIKKKKKRRKKRSKVLRYSGSALQIEVTMWFVQRTSKKSKQKEIVASS